MAGILGAGLSLGSKVFNPSAREIFAKMTAARDKGIIEAVNQEGSVSALSKLNQLQKQKAKDVFKLENITKEGEQFTPEKFFFRGKGNDKYHMAYTKTGKDGQRLAYWKGYWRPLDVVKDNILRSGSSRKAFAAGSNTNATAMHKLAKRMAAGEKERLFHEGPLPAPGRKNISTNTTFQWIAQDLEKGINGGNVKSQLRNYLKGRAKDGNPYIDASGKEITSLPQLDRWGVKHLYSKFRGTPEVEVMFGGAGKRPVTSKATRAFIKDQGWSGKKNIETLQSRMRSMGLNLKDLEAYVGNSKAGMERIIPLAGKTDARLGMVKDEQVPGDVWMRNIYNRKDKPNLGRAKGIKETKIRKRRTQSQMRQDKVPLEDDIDDFLLRQSMNDLGEGS